MNVIEQQLIAGDHRLQIKPERFHILDQLSGSLKGHKHAGFIEQRCPANNKLHRHHDFPHPARRRSKWATTGGHRR
jgi:hypothetical protein